MSELAGARAPDGEGIRSPRWPRILAWTVLGIGIALELAAIPLALAVEEAVDFTNAAGLAIFSVGPIWVATGALIVSRQPRNWAGWLFCFVGLSVCLSIVAQPYAIYGLRVAPGSLPFVGLVAWLNEYVFLSIALIPLLFLLFPDGRVPGPRWRLAVVGLLGGVGLAFLSFSVRDQPFNNLLGYGIEYQNPFGIAALGDLPGTLIGIGTVVAMVSAVACVLGLRARYRRATGDERQRTRWLVVVATTAAALFVTTFVMMAVTVVFRFDGDGSAPIFPIMLALTATTVAFGIPAAFLVAIFRYGLWNLDLVIRKTVVIGLLAVFIGFVYTAIVGGLGWLIGSGSAALSFVAAAVLSVAFAPARDRARRVADRLVYGTRATPYEVLTEFSGRVADSYDSEDVLPRMAQVLREGVGADVAVVWLEVDGRPHVAAVDPPQTPVPVAPPTDAVDVIHQGERLGALSVAMPASDPMTPARLQLVEDVAAQAGLVLRNVRLIEELRASRQRLVTAQDEERRRLERNIHDGVQQQLVALNVQLGLVARTAERDPARAASMATALQAQATTTLEDLRDLARGIYPPLLADKGLLVALESQARKAAIPVTVEGDRLGRFGQDIEAAVYFCTLEALNNVAKYAASSRATVSLTQAGGVLAFSVSDDGPGFDTSATGYGTGLQGMADRIDAIGGTVEVRSTLGQGTTVWGRLPVTALSGTEPPVDG